LALGSSSRGLGIGIQILVGATFVSFIKKKMKGGFVVTTKKPHLLDSSFRIEHHDTILS